VYQFRWWRLASLFQPHSVHAHRLLQAFQFLFTQFDKLERQASWHRFANRFSDAHASGKRQLFYPLS
jgi:hypothetical protein